ncbi:MAG: FtsQ-type POTRA domain-containing protein [Parvularculaceae bacterium]
MPPVKKKRQTRTRKQKQPSFLERMASVFERYTIASLAGASAIFGIVVLFLWAGGYFAFLGRTIDNTARKVAVGSGLEVRRVLLRGAHQTANDEVVAALGPVIGQSLPHISLNEARARVENLGWIRSAAVTRLYPDTISISVREREPAAVWQIKGDFKLIDDTGAIIRQVGAYEYSNLPLIVGSGAPEAASGILKSIGKHTALQERTYALVRVGERRWNMRLRNNIDIKLPELEYAKAIDDLALLQTAQGTLDQPIEYIDLRDPERMVVKPRGEASSSSPSPQRAL